MRRFLVRNVSLERGIPRVSVNAGGRVLAPGRRQAHARSGRIVARTQDVFPENVLNRYRLWEHRDLGQLEIFELDIQGRPLGEQASEKVLAPVVELPVLPKQKREPSAPKAKKPVQDPKAKEMKDLLEPPKIKGKPKRKAAPKKPVVKKTAASKPKRAVAKKKAAPKKTTRKKAAPKRKAAPKVVAVKEHKEQTDAAAEALADSLLHSVLGQED